MPSGLRPLLLAALGSGVALAALAGCGGETRRAETETESSAAPAAAAPAATAPRHVPVAKVTDPRRRAYIARTDRVCRRFDPERSTARKRAGESADIHGAVRAYEEDTALGSAELRQIEAVPPPPGDAALLRANVFDPIRRQLALRARIRGGARRRRRDRGCGLCGANSTTSAGRCRRSPVATAGASCGEG